jgi:rSAM/selenodomain-associated transferase 1
MSRASLDTIRIAILTKAPEPGRVKTRLAMMLGSDGAALLHERFVIHTVKTAVAAAIGPITIWTDPDERHPFFQKLAREFSVPLARQPEGDLGARMHAAFVHRGEATIVIGTDCPVLTPTHLRDAASVLRDGADAVIFSAEDGGYALIGLSRPVPELFTAMAWSTELVMVETRKRLRQLGLSWREPGQLWDVDRPSDVGRMRREGLTDLLAGIDRRAQKASGE